ncbi:hypothetical protein B0H16DRAFT_1453441 [Mycena metata]|uniref:Uncharacterized protein n=1 Tax=Mycena metata TaxID=1033252 RepID=A0AAD7JPR8_9AGAR|nr:hypothetical protein B0H16DRAFT_1453441 [Mycena metata]
MRTTLVVLLLASFVSSRIVGIHCDWNVLHGNTVGTVSVLEVGVYTVTSFPHRSGLKHLGFHFGNNPDVPSFKILTVESKQGCNYGTACEGTVGVPGVIGKEEQKQLQLTVITHSNLGNGTPSSDFDSLEETLTVCYTPHPSCGIPVAVVIDFNSTNTFAYLLSLDLVGYWGPGPRESNPVPQGLANSQAGGQGALFERTGVMFRIFWDLREKSTQNQAAKEILNTIDPDIRTRGVEPLE